MSKLKELRDRRAAIVRNGEQVVSTYTVEERDPTEQEMNNLLDLAGERETLDLQITELEARQDLERGFQTVGESVRITGGTPVIESDPSRGFPTFGSFAVAVMKSSRKGAVIDDRLKIGAAPTTVTNQGVGSEGGFLVPEVHGNQIMSDSLEDDALLPETDNVQIGGNSMPFPCDEDMPHDSSGTGVRAAWEDELDQLAQTNLDLKMKRLELRKLTALVPISEEMMEDFPAVESYIEGRAAEAIRWKTNDALLTGTGAGRPRGVVGATGTVSVAKETSQTAATVVIENLLKMYSRNINPRRAIWTANISTFPQLYDMKDNAGARVYQTAVAGLPGNMDGLLIGRPLRFVEACPTLGTVGDIVFGDWKQYRTITKSSGVTTATSVHLWFDYDVVAFKARFRIDGQPWRSSPMNPGKGALTRGHFTTVATRA